MSPARTVAWSSTATGGCRSTIGGTGTTVTPATHARVNARPGNESARDLAGVVVLVGVPDPQMKLELPLIDVFSRGGAVKSSWYGDCLPSRDFPMLVDLFQQGRLPLDRFVTETIALDGVEDAFARMQEGAVLRSVVRF